MLFIFMVLPVAYVVMAGITSKFSGASFSGSYRTGINRGIFWPIALPIMLIVFLGRWFVKFLEGCFYEGRGNG